MKLEEQLIRLNEDEIFGKNGDGMYEMDWSYIRKNRKIYVVIKRVIFDTRDYIINSLIE